MRRTLAIVFTLSSAALGSCAKPDASADSTAGRSAAANAAPAGTDNAAKLGETGGMKVPESVRYDADQDVYFVSNINGNPSQKDNNGFIARVRADSTGVMTMLAEGGKNGVTLNAPKGMAIGGDTLFVADIDAVRMFDRKTGKSLGSVDLASQKATFLNDVVRTPDGSVWVTDTGIRFGADGSMTHPGTDRIFRIKSGKATAAQTAANANLSNPNGIAWMGNDSTHIGTFILAPFGSNDVQQFTVGPQQTPIKIVSGPGQYDGIEVLGDGRILVSSWADSAVHVIRTQLVNGLLQGTMSKLVSGVSAPADIGVDSKRNILAIPRFNDGKVEYYKLP